MYDFCNLIDLYRLWVDLVISGSNTVLLAELVLCGRSLSNRMKIEHYVARLATTQNL
jgi:hypothetical protein